MKKALIIVDYQYDFVAKDGQLSVGENARKIEKNIEIIVDEYIKNGDEIIVLLDTHKKSEWANHTENKNFCMHCEKNTKGHEIYGNVKKVFEYNKAVYIEKCSYTPNEKYIYDIIKTYEKIEICGVVTDICVLQTAILLYNLSVNASKNIDFFIYKSACASFSEKRHINALNYMKNILGFKII